MIFVKVMDHHWLCHLLLARFRFVSLGYTVNSDSYFHLLTMTSSGYHPHHPIYWCRFSVAFATNASSQMSYCERPLISCRLLRIAFSILVHFGKIVCLVSTQWIAMSIAQNFWAYWPRPTRRWSFQSSLAWGPPSLVWTKSLTLEWKDTTDCGQ